MNDRLGDAMEQTMGLEHWLLHGGSMIAIAGTIIGYIPALVSLIPAIFYLIKIYQTQPVQDWFQRKRIRKIERLQRLLKKLEGR